MPELPELEALRIRLAPRLTGKLITAASVNPKKAHLLRYPVENFALELPARRITSMTRRGKHLVFATELGGGGSPRWLVINPMLLYEQDKEIRSSFSLIFDNARFGAMLLPDIKSIYQNLALGERLLNETIDRYGIDAYLGALRYSCDSAAESMRTALQSMPDGGNNVPLVSMPISKPFSCSASIASRSSCSKGSPPVQTT